MRVLSAAGHRANLTICIGAIILRTVRCQAGAPRERGLLICYRSHSQVKTSGRKDRLADNPHLHARQPGASARVRGKQRSP